MAAIQAESEHTSLREVLFDRDIAAHAAGCRSGRVKAESETAFAALVESRGAVEPVERAAHLPRRHAESLIGELDRGEIVFRVSLHLHRTVRRRVFGRV